MKRVKVNLGTAAAKFDAGLASLAVVSASAATGSGDGGGGGGRDGE